MTPDICLPQSGCHGDDVAQAAVERPTTRLGDWMQTFTGNPAYPLDLRPDEIQIQDIAHSLSMQCRFAGHCLRFYSVGEHSVHIARYLLPRHGPDVALEGLLHDASEAYLVDVPRPVKPFLHGYREAEDKAHRVIAERFGLAGDMLAAVKAADNAILHDERQQNMAPCTKAWDLPGGALEIALQFWSPDRAKREFLGMFEELYGEDR